MRLKMVFLILFSLNVFAQGTNQRDPDRLRARILKEHPNLDPKYLTDQSLSAYLSSKESLKRLQLVHEPKLYRQVRNLVERFTALDAFQGNEIIESLIVNDQFINATVSEHMKENEYDQMQKFVSESTGARIIEIRIHSALVKAFSDPQYLTEIVPGLSKNLKESLLAAGEGALAAVIAHELGHFLHGHLKSTEGENPAKEELEADFLGLRLLRQAGFNPELMKLPLLFLKEMYQANKKSFDLIASMVADHPHPVFRLAALEEEVLNLKQQDENLNRVYLKNRPLHSLRDARYSNRSLEKEEKYYLTDEYQRKSLRDKLQDLERRFLDKGFKNYSFNLKQYETILNGLSSLEDVNRLTDSFSRFHRQVSHLWIHSDHKETMESYGAMARQFQAKLSRKTLEALQAKGINTELSNLPQWARYIDKNIIIGEMLHQIQSAQTIEEIDRVLQLFQDHHSREFQRVFKTWTNIDYGYFFEKVFLAHLRIHKNIGTAFTYATKYLRYEGGTLVGLEGILVSLVHYVFNRSAVNWGNFLDRLERPSDKLDEIVLGLLNTSLEKNKIFLGAYARSKKRLPSFDSLKNNQIFREDEYNKLKADAFSYFVGKTFRRTIFDPQFVRFLILSKFMDHKSSSVFFNSLFRDVSKNAYQNNGKKPHIVLNQFFLSYQKEIENFPDKRIGKPLVFNLDRSLIETMSLQERADFIQEYYRGFFELYLKTGQIKISDQAEDATNLFKYLSSRANRINPKDYSALSESIRTSFSHSRDIGNYIDDLKAKAKVYTLYTWYEILVSVSGLVILDESNEYQSFKSVWNLNQLLEKNSYRFLSLPDRRILRYMNGKNESLETYYQSFSQLADFHKLSFGFSKDPILIDFDELWHKIIEISDGLAKVDVTNPKEKHAKKLQQSFEDFLYISGLGEYSGLENIFSPGSKDYIGKITKYVNRALAVVLSKISFSILPEIVNERDPIKIFRVANFLINSSHNRYYDDSASIQEKFGDPQVEREKLFVTLASIALRKVQTQDQMKQIVKDFYRAKHSFNILTFDYQKIENLSSSNLMTEFSEKFIQKVNQLDAWPSSKSIGSSKRSLFERLGRMSMWSLELDKAIRQHIFSNDIFEDKEFFTSKRDHLMSYLQMIKSPRIKNEVYEEIVAEYGHLNNSWWNVTKTKMYLWLKGYRIRKVWGQKTIDLLLNSTSQVERLAILTEAWKNGAEKKAGDSSFEKELRILHELYTKLSNIKDLRLSEIKSIFPEKTTYHDDWIEKYIQSSELSLEQIKALEKEKGINSHSPVNKFKKVSGDLLLEFMERTTSNHQYQFMLYLSGVKPSLDNEIEDAYKKLFRNSRNRGKALARSGIYIDFKQLRNLFDQMHPEERYALFRSMFFADIKNRSEVEARLTEEVLLNDRSMPEYLQKLIRIVVQVSTPLDRAKMFSWILANSYEGVLNGPRVFQLLTEQGSVATAKLGQLVASYGFRLPEEYQEASEKFKNKAQKVVLADVVEELKSLLRPEHYSQISKINRLYGAGSFKIAFGATLKNGQRVIIKKHRPYLNEQIQRENALMDAALELVMADPELRLSNLPDLVDEVKRIISEEKNTLLENEFMKEHKQNVEKRPLFVRLFTEIGVSVYVPQTLESWITESVIVEEFVEAKSFDELPDRSFYGWSKEGLAKSVIREIINQMISYVNLDQSSKEKALIDIDPHEQNQLAKKGFLNTKANLVNIDLGQSVKVSPETMREVSRLLVYVYYGDIENAVKHSELLLNYHQIDSSKSLKEKLNLGTTERFRDQLEKAMQKSRDPIEVLTMSLEEMQIKGVGLKKKYIFFQKLFSTMIGLKKHVRQEDFMTKAFMKAAFLHGVSDPKVFLREKEVLGISFLKRSCRSSAKDSSKP